MYNSNKVEYNQKKKQLHNIIQKKIDELNVHTIIYIQIT